MDVVAVVTLLLTSAVVYPVDQSLQEHARRNER